MLMFAFHLAFLLGLIAFALGAMLLAKAKQVGTGMVLSKILAYLIMLFALLNIICTSYYGHKFWSAGYFDKPCPMMMKDNMMQKPMM
jgi:hypothetical protein